MRASAAPGPAASMGLALALVAPAALPAAQGQFAEALDQLYGALVPGLPERPFGPDLRAFQGANYLGPPEVMGAMGLGWARESFPCGWDAVEPTAGEWHWEAFDRRILDAYRQGVQVLPMLGYCAPWAASIPGDGFSPPRSTIEWENYVEHMVARYTRPPFNVRYFQVWNEPTWEPLTFWHASGERWVDEVFIPAARIIRRYGGQVVFGGWPVADAGHLTQALDYHDAYRYTDIVDVHYFGSTVFQDLYDRYVAPGPCRGIWQTEIGYHTYPNCYPNLYLRVLHWALRHDWHEVDQYKLFWFASWGAGLDAERCLTGPGPEGNYTPSEHGRRATVMARVLGDGRLGLWEGFRADPALPPALEEETPTMLGFTVEPSRRVVALILDPDTVRDHPTVVLEVPGTPGEHVSVRLVDVLGTETAVPWSPTGDGLRMEVAAGSLTPYVARGWGREWRAAIAYVVIEER